MSKNMSRKFKQSYNSFHREILREFMTEEELKELDIKYTSAKIKRLTTKIFTETGIKV